MRIPFFIAVAVIVLGLGSWGSRDTGFSGEEQVQDVEMERVRSRVAADLATQAGFPPEVTAALVRPEPGIEGRPSPRRYKRHVERYAAALANGEIPASPPSELTPEEKQKVRAQFLGGIEQAVEGNP